MTTQNAALQEWIDEVSTLTKPDQVVWCDGSEEEYQRLINEMLESGDLVELSAARTRKMWALTITGWNLAKHAQKCASYMTAVCRVAQCT